MRPFKLKLPNEDKTAFKQPVVRLSQSYYLLLTNMKRKTGLPLGNIVEQCIDYAMENREEDYADT